MSLVLQDSQHQYVNCMPGCVRVCTHNVCVWECACVLSGRWYSMIGVHMREDSAARL